MLSGLSRLQDQIGLDHDVAVLRARLKKTPDAFGGNETVQRVIACLDRETRELHQASVPLGQKIWRQKPCRFAYKVARHWRKR